MTLGELFAMLGEALNNGADDSMPVILRAVDRYDDMIVCDLSDVTMDAGCTDELALVLDGNQEDK